MVGTDTSDAMDACRAPAPPEPLGAEMEKWTCAVSIAHVMFPVGMKFGQGPVDASEEKLTVPVAAYQFVTAPPFPTESMRPFTLPSPIVPLSDIGAVAVPDCANPLTSTRLVR